MKIITISNAKGGVGKTSLTQNLAVGMAKKGYKIAIIDFDKQANLTNSFDILKSNFIEDKLENQKQLTINDFDQINENLYILGNTKDGITSKINSWNDLKKYNALKSILGGLEYFDYILIDTSPYIDAEVILCYIASDYILIPINIDKYSIDGLQDMFQNLKDIQPFNPKIRILGVVANKIDLRLKDIKGILKTLQDKLGEGIFNTTISVSNNYINSQQANQSVYDYESKLWDKKGTKDYNNLITEILNKTK
jgi:chromosome partitioning protein